MNDLVILGTDTDAGKTTFALLWMAAFADEFEYWKPLETGESDSAALRRLVPAAIVHPPFRHFAKPVAPLLAARDEQAVIPRAIAVAAARPTSQKRLLIETFGGPFSPLNEDELQVELVRALGMSCVLVTSSAVGAIGRSLQCLQALKSQGIVPAGVVLLGKHDGFAVEQIQRYWTPGVEACVQPPSAWNEKQIKDAAATAREVLLSLDLASRERKRPECVLRSLTLPARQIVERDRQAIWHPYTSLGDPAEPLVCVGAQDEFLHLADGRHVIDAISSWWTILHGHRHPVLMAALEEASKKFDHVLFAGMTHEPAVELAEMMLQTMPWQRGRVFYSDNGSTAVEVALKMAYQFWCHQGEPRRTRFIGFQNGYHGDTFGAMAVGRDPVFFGRFEPFLFQASVIPLDPELLDAELTKHGSEVAAVIIEPLVQGAGGMRMHSPAALRDLASIAHKHGVLFIADEVMTGGRTNTLWAHQAAQIVPDLICAGKTLAGGLLPLAATLAAPHIVQAFQTPDRSKTFFHGHSFTAHPLACAVGVANWKMTASAGAAAKMESFWNETLRPLGQSAKVRDVRICGSIAAMELNVEGGYLATVGGNIRAEGLKHGVFLRPLGNVVYAMPPLLTSHESLNRIADAVKAA
ncbi:MAG TPA: adenosylmethionine--8-amino-7-oxononanoate transaminase, partial [Gemmataceae bacterium]|nr:adenosylmethionine--8-amino-7-oxononanoate transaminase [Gemmataceae bacterium]